MERAGAKERAYRLSVMLGTIVDDFSRGECVVSKGELEEMYGYASEINQYFEEETNYGKQDDLPAVSSVI